MKFFTLPIETITIFVRIVLSLHDRIAQNKYFCWEKLDWIPEIGPTVFPLFSLVSFLKKKKEKKDIRWAAGVCVSVCVCVCVCVCMCVCVCLCKILVPPINFQTSYQIDTKFWLHIVSYRNSPTPLIPFLNFENCALEKFFKFIFSPFN